MSYLRLNHEKKDDKSRLFNDVINETQEVVSPPESNLDSSLNIILEQQILLDKVSTASLNESDQKILIERVFNSSITDGLKLAEKENYTNQKYLELISSPQFYLKHAKLATNLLKEAEAEAKSESDKKEIQKLKETYEEYEKILESDNNKRLLKETEPGSLSAKELLKEIDNWYAQFLKTKNIEAISEKDPRSKGESLGEEALEQLKLSLQKNYYSRTVMDIIVKEIRETRPELLEGKDEATQGVEILSTALSKKELESISSSWFLSEDIVKKLSAHYEIKDDKKMLRALYKPLDLTAKARARQAEKELIKEITADGYKIKWDEETQKYELNSEKKERPETKHLSEEKILDKLDEYIKLGAYINDIARGMAGLDSDRAWKMREEFVELGSYNASIAQGLAGLDSDRAWKMRGDLIESGADNSIFLGLAGLDSDRAWKMRKEFEESGVSKDSIAQGLAGDYTTFVWQLNKNKSISEEYVSEEAERKLKLLNILNTLLPVEIKTTKQEINEQEKPEKIETKFLSEEKILDKLEEFIKLGADKDNIAQSLAGLDSDRAWKMREEFIDSGASKEYIAMGLAGLDSDRAWKMREYFINLGVNKSKIALSLAGLNSDRAWKMREAFINLDVYKGSIALGLAGLDSDRAWKMREEFIKGGVNKNYMARGLAGVDSDRAWQMREEFIKSDVSKDDIANSLAGLDSDRAWKMRAELIELGSRHVQKEFIARSLTGLDSERAWRMREEFVKSGVVSKSNIAEGLAGLDSERAWRMREEFVKSGMNKGYIAEGLAGDYNTFVWQLNKNNKENEKIIVSSTPKKEKNEFDADKLYQEISLYLENDSLLAENNKKSPTQKIRSSLSTGKNLVVAMGAMLKEAPGALLNTLSAKKDERNLTRKLARRVFPSMFLEKENNWRGFSGYSGFNEGRSRSSEPQPQDYLNPDSPESMLGGNPEGGAGESPEVMRFREPVNDLIVTGIYGKANGQSWDSSYQFKVAKSTMEKAKEITITLPSVGSKVKLPKLINSNIISERVRGLKNKNENPLEVEISPMREGVVRETKKAEEIIYSIEIDELPKKILEISSDEYVTFKEQFVRANGSEMNKTLVELPAEIDLFLSSLKDRDPKEQVQEIENFVRSICYYDMKNGEMINLKQGKDLAERLEIMEARVEELKINNKDTAKNLAGKKYAGVCADFAVLTAAILRQAGFSSGVLAGFMPDGGKSVTVDQAHATAFVVWPNAKKENEIFSVDGTPSGVAGVSRPSLVEQESSREEKIKEIEAEAESQLEEIMKTLDSLDAAAIKELTNGKLESALNTILRYGVEAENLKVIKTILEAYWYSPLHKYDLNETDDQIKFLKFFENEVNRARQEAPVEREADPGSKLFETVELFTQRFSKEGDMKKAFVILEKINDLASRSLSSNEKKALTATITYLEAKKIKAS